MQIAVTRRVPPQLKLNPCSRDDEHPGTSVATMLPFCRTPQDALSARAEISAVVTSSAPDLARTHVRNRAVGADNHRRGATSGDIKALSPESRPQLVNSKQSFDQSGWRDSNPRPPAPKSAPTGGLTVPEIAWHAAHLQH